VHCLCPWFSLLLPHMQCVMHRDALAALARAAALVALATLATAATSAAAAATQAASKSLLDSDGWMPLRPPLKA
jgi:hypothetical protein